MTRHRAVPFLAAIAGLVFVSTAGCSAAGGSGATSAGGSAAPLATSSSAPGSAAPSPTASSSSSSSSRATPTTAMGKRCGAPDVEAALDTVPGPAGERVALATVGSGPTVAALLHQTDRVASCGWWRFANQLARDGVRAEMVDFCGYGLSTCDTAWSGDYVDQVVRVVARLRGTGATRVTLVGASIGGTVASLSAAPAKVDAVVNLSGFGFCTMVTAPAIKALGIPILGGGSHDEETESLAAQAEVLAAPGPTTRFVWDQGRHGYSLVFDGPTQDAPVSPVGRAVLGWVQGRYAE